MILMRGVHFPIYSREKFHRENELFSSVRVALVCMENNAACAHPQTHIGENGF
jgi:hypothetical protein